MADDLNDLGIVYKDESRSSPKSAMAKDNANDDLGIVFKNEEQKKPEESSGILNDILQAGGTAGRAIGYGLSDIINVPVAAANYANQKVAGLFGVKPENVPTPDQFDPSQLSMPFVSQEKQNQLDPFARGIATTAELATPALDTAKLVATGGKALVGKLSNLTGYNANAKATDFIKNLVGNQPEIKKAFQKGYTAIDSLADKKGYNLLVNKTQKPIEANTFKSELAGLSNDDRTTLFNSLNAKKKALLDKFIDKPSYDNAHGLQSMLGRQGIKFVKNPETAQTGHEILNLRNLLNNDIHQTFQKYGDTDLLNARQDITSQYAQNQNRLLLADKLKGGAQKFSDEGITANASKVANRYGKRGFEESLGKPGPTLTNLERDAAINEIRKALSRRSTTNWALGLGIPASIAGETIRRYLR